MAFTSKSLNAAQLSVALPNLLSHNNSHLLLSKATHMNTTASPKRIRLVRESVSKVVHLLSGKRVPVTQKGSRAFVQTDPETLAPIKVNIPVIEDSATNVMLDAIQGFIDHEVAHILFTDDAVGVAANQESAALGRYWNIVEDTFIERRMSKEFLGAGHNLSNTRNRKGRFCKS